MKGLQLEIRNEAINAIAKRVKKKLDHCVDSIFVEAQGELDVKDGGIMPGVSLEIESLVDDLTKLISESLYYQWK